MVLNENLDRDPKSQLQEWSQARLAVTPRYKLVTAEGPDHAKTFTVEVWLGDIVAAVGTGSSKQVAEQSAARTALNSPGGQHTNCRAGNKIAQRKYSLPRSRGHQDMIRFANRRERKRRFSGVITLSCVAYARSIEYCTLRLRYRVSGHPVIPTSVSEEESWLMTYRATW